MPDPQRDDGGPRARRPAASALALAILFLIAPPLRAADPSRLQYYRLGMEDGLANNSVYCAIQDSRGLMWFGTFGGLSRYDGESFVTYRPHQGSGGEGFLAASVVFALLEDASGWLWVGTDGGGLARYRPETDSFEVYRAEPGRPGRLPSDRVFALAQDRKGRLWVGMGDGSLGVFDAASGGFQVSRPDSWSPKPIRCLLVDAKGDVWAGTEGGGLLRRDEATGKFRVYLHDRGNAASLASNTVRSLLQDSRGRVWAGLSGGGVDRLEGDSFLHCAPPKGGVLPAEAVRALAQDAEGSIWVGFADSGLGSIDPERLELRPPGRGAEAMIRSIYHDQGGQIWVGMKDGGLRTYNLGSARFDRYTARGDGKPLRDLRGLCELGPGRILAGTDGGGLLLVDAVRARIEPFPGLPADRVSQKVYAVLRAKDGTIWAGTDGGGLVRIAASGRTRVYRHDEAAPGSLASDVVWALHADPDGTLWVGTESGGLDRFVPSSESFIHHRPDSTGSSILGSSVRAIFRDSKGRLWVGTWDGGLSRMDPGERSFRGVGQESSSPSSLGDASVNCIYEDRKGNIWVGTGGSGLAKLDPATGKFEHWAEAQGLRGSTVYGIAEDGVGDLWASTSMGLSRLEPASGKLLSFGLEDGLASKDLSQNSLLLASDGKIWAGGGGGLTSFDPAKLPRTAAAPRVAILGVDTPDAETAALRLSSEPGGPSELRLDYRNSGLSFHIAVLDYASTGRNRYAMRLEGRQEAWTDLGTHSEGSIAPLAPGRYTLRVKGSNGNGVWNEEGAALSILVSPPFWRTWWFRLGLSVLALALAAGIIAMRVRSFRQRTSLLVGFSRHIEAAREEERIAAAREVHDEIGQHLAAINLQAYWLRGHPAAGPGEREEHLVDMLGSISDAMGSVKAVATALRPVALDALAFDEALRWYLRSFERRSGIKTSVEIGEEVPHVEGPLATALFRILQEMLTNALRHSGARNVTLRYHLEEGNLLLEVDDDGKGIEEERVHARDSFGIMGMRERCAAFGGALSVWGRAGAGTTFVATIPYPQPGAAGGAGGRAEKSAGGRAALGRLSGRAAALFGRHRC